MLAFSQQGVDLAVLEVGLGGRLDSTNTCSPCVSVITTISFDHTKQLGNTLTAIAREKAGIIKPGIPVVCGVEQSEPLVAIRSVSDEHGSPFFVLGEDFGYSIEQTGSFRFWQRRPLEWELSSAALALQGSHQIHNAAVALATVGVLKSSGLVLHPDSVLKGLQAVTCPARIEVVGRQPLRVVDSAHNVASIQALADFIEEDVSGERRLVFATSGDKDARGMLQIVAAHFDRVTLTRFQSNQRSVSPDDLLDVVEEAGLREKCVWEVCQNPLQAWNDACRGSDKSGAIVVAGSFFLAAELRPHLVSGSNNAAATH